MHRGLAGWRNGVINRRRKQRMSEADDAVRPNHQSPGRNRLVERNLSFADGTRKDGWGRSFRSRHGRKQRKDRGRQTTDAIADELFERRRKRQWAADGRGDLRELEREHRIAARGLVHTRHRRSRDAQAETRPNQMVEGADTQRADADLRDVLLEGMAEIEGVTRVAALRDQDPDRSVAKPSRREGEDPLRRRVEPLDVVDRYQHRRATCEDAQIRQEGARQSRGIRCLVRRRFESDHDGERPPLRLGELVRDLGESSLDQVADAAERERHLRLGTPRHQKPDARCPRDVDCAAPKSRLPDSGLTADDDSSGPDAQIEDEPLEACQLVLSPD